MKDSLYSVYFSRDKCTYSIFIIGFYNYGISSKEEGESIHMLFLFSCIRLVYTVFFHQQFSVIGIVLFFPIIHIGNLLIFGYVAR